MFSLYFLSLRYIKLLLYLRLLLGNTFDIIRLLVKMLYTFSLFQFFKEQNKFFVELNGIEPLTSALQGRRSPN